MSLEQLYTLREVADHCKVGVATVRNWIDRGLIPSLKIGAGVRVAESDLQVFIYNQEESSHGETL
jgi:excisionase family DNA binding protein